MDDVQFKSNGQFYTNSRNCKFCKEVLPNISSTLTEKDFTRKSTETSTNGCQSKLQTVFERHILKYENRLILINQSKLTVIMTLQNRIGGVLKSMKNIPIKRNSSSISLLPLRQLRPLLPFASLSQKFTYVLRTIVSSKADNENKEFVLRLCDEIRFVLRARAFPGLSSGFGAGKHTLLYSFEHGGVLRVWRIFVSV